MPMVDEELPVFHGRKRTKVNTEWVRIPPPDVTNQMTASNPIQLS